MSFYVIEHAGAKFASGMFWQVLSRPREARQESKELGESMQFDLMLLRTAGAVVQAGFAAHGDGAADGMVSLAALVARAVEVEPEINNWIAAIQLPNEHFAYVVVRDGAILPDGDMAGTKDEILNRMAQDYSLGEWDAVVCPLEFDFPESQEKLLADFLPVDKKGKFTPPGGVLIEPVKKKLPIKQIAIVVAALGLGFAAYSAFESYMAAQAQAEAERMVAEQKARMEEEERQRAMTSPPWAGIDDSMSLIRGCEEMAYTLDLKPAGWSFDNATCTRGGSGQVTYKRGDSPSTVLDIKAAFGDQLRTPWSGDQGVLSKTFKVEKATRDKLLKADDAATQMIGLAQSYGLKLTVNPPASGQGPAMQSAPEQNTFMRFKVLTFTGQSNVQLSMYEPVFKLPGVRMKAMKIDQAGQWSFEGEIYVDE